MCVVQVRNFPNGTSLFIQKNVKDAHCFIGPVQLLFQPPKSPTLWVPHTHTSFSFINFWDLFWLLLSCWWWCIMWQGGVWTLLLFYATYYSKTSKLPLLIAWEYHHIILFKPLARGELQSYDSGGHLIDWLVLMKFFSGYSCPMAHGFTPILLMSPPLLVVLVAWIEWEMLVHR